MAHNVELISVGTELLLGNILNTDAQFLSQELAKLGLNVYYHTVVGDNPERLTQAVNLAKTRADIIITTGGLGPTCDDLTKETLAACFGKKLVLDLASQRHMEEYFKKGLKTCTIPKSNEKQAFLPENCVVFQNDWGTAPGCAFQAEGVHVLMLPGPPGECTPLFLHCALPYLKALSEETILSRSLRLFGLGESAVEEVLRDRMNALQNPTLAPYAKEGEVELRITAKAPNEAAARALIAPVEVEVRKLFGEQIYGADVGSLEEVVLALLTKQHLTLGCSESCTGGLIAKRITDLPGASAVFLGGIVSYTNAVKHDVLGVPQDTLDRYGAVSPQVAAAMAEGARHILNCDIALSTTGVAGPASDENGNPVGLVYVGIATKDGTAVRELHLGTVRSRVRTRAASTAFDMVRRAVMNPS